MPSPVGHALSGLAVAGLVVAAAGRRPSAPPIRFGALAWWAAVAAVAPDLDLLLASHRTFTHSLATALLVGLLAWVSQRHRDARWARLCGAACALSWAAHVGLDWLGKDSSPPHGVMALWPVSSAYFVSGLDLFREISRRYWNPDEFVVRNMMAIGREVAILLPPAAVAWWAARRRPVAG